MNSDELVQAALKNCIDRKLKIGGQCNIDDLIRRSDKKLISRARIAIYGIISCMFAFVWFAFKPKTDWVVLSIIGTWGIASTAYLYHLKTFQDRLLESIGTKEKSFIEHWKGDVVGKIRIIKYLAPIEGGGFIIALGAMWYNGNTDAALVLGLISIVLLAFIVHQYLIVLPRYKLELSLLQKES